MLMAFCAGTCSLFLTESCHTTKELCLTVNLLISQLRNHNELSLITINTDVGLPLFYPGTFLYKSNGVVVPAGHFNLQCAHRRNWTENGTVWMTRATFYTPLPVLACFSA
jgi:hypothetical protein